MAVGRLSRELLLPVPNMFRNFFREVPLPA